MEIWFWQKIISPHMAALAVEIARQGGRVWYVAERGMSDERRKQGWCPPELPGVNLCYMSERSDIQTLVKMTSSNVMHICEGIRSNGLVGVAQSALAKRGFRYWVAMETLEDVGVPGFLRRLLYRFLFWRAHNDLVGVLSIGHRTSEWVNNRGFSKDNIFPFTYFLSDVVLGAPKEDDDADPRVRVLFVGQLIDRKCVDLLIRALAEIAVTHPTFVLQIIGTGPLENSLRYQAAQGLGPQVQWLGQLPMDQVRAAMTEADCLVLPSRHDGWGAVVSEALMAGTPAICSDRCGSAEAVLASGTGGVFPSGDQRALEVLLSRQILQGRQTPAARKELAKWARSLGAEAGARYLLEILSFQEGAALRPLAPWRRIEAMNSEIAS